MTTGYFVRGFQEAPEDPYHIQASACCKHYVADSMESTTQPDGEHYPVVIINWVQYLGPPVPFSFPDSRDLLEVLGDFLGRERGGGSLGDPPGP